MINDEKILVTKSSMPPYEEYIEAIKPLWDSHWLTNMGVYHEQLESRLKDYLDVPNISLMVNGHMALELVIQAFDFPKGAEVITTPYTFISTTHAIVRNGLTPVFCDVKASDGTIDEDKIEALITDKTVAIVPVHVYGNVCNVDVIQEIADRHGLKVIYDAAHAFGIKYKGRGIGSYGDAAIYSFHATKVFNTIEGGAVAFRDESLYEKLYNLKNFGIRDEELTVEVGANAKMNEFAAVMGLCNLNHIEEYIAGRGRIVDFYEKALSEVKGIKLLTDTIADNHNYGYFPIIVEDEYSLSRNELANKFSANGIYARKYFYPLTSDQACFEHMFDNATLDIARDMSQRVLVLPVSDSLTIEQAQRIVNIIKE